MRIRYKNDTSKEAREFREKTRQTLIGYYYNQYMNNFKLPELDYQAQDYFLRKMWGEGTLACLPMKANDEKLVTEEHPNGELVFTTYAPMEYNHYDFPTLVSLLNPRNSPAIPITPQKVDKDVVIGYAQRNKKSIYSIVKYYVDKIVEVEMILRTNLKTHKMPWIIGFNPESKEKMDDFKNNLDNDEPYLFIELNDVNSAKALTSGSTYIADKLYNLKKAYESDLREYLGINSLGVGEKKEHLITSEVETNNEIVESSGECLFDTLKEFCDRVSKTFGIPLSIELTRPQQEEISSEVEKEEGEEQDETL